MVRSIKIVCLLLFLCICTHTPAFAEELPSQLKKMNVSLTENVVKVFVTSNNMDYYRPWQSKGIKASSGSGAIIRGNQILTNAHVVSDHTFIQVKKDNDPKKYTAEVVAIGHDCDLALLEVNDPNFFDNISPLEFGDLPNKQDNVTVVGYPEGGGKISITEGVVSRIEVTSYAQSSRRLLTVQIDAAINPGNSGGPVIQDGKLVGIAMQIFQSGQNIGYMIPILVIDHFLEDLKDGAYDGFPMLGIDYKNTENATLREYYGIKDIDDGVFIAKVLPFSSASDHLKEEDIILTINGVPIGQDGTFPFRGEERLSLTHLVTKEKIGEDIELEIIRNKQAKKISMRLDPFVTLVPQAKYFEKPPFYIFGGLVFTVLSTDLVHAWGSRWWEKAPLDLVYYSVGTGRLNALKRKEVIILLNVLPDDINVGYHSMRNDVVEKVNDQVIKSFEDFVIQINKVKNNEKYTIISTEHKSRIILNNENIEEVNQRILKRNNIPYQFSKDVAQWLEEEN